VLNPSVQPARCFSDGCFSDGRLLGVRLLGDWGNAARATGSNRIVANEAPTIAVRRVTIAIASVGPASLGMASPEMASPEMASTPSPLAELRLRLFVTLVPTSDCSLLTRHDRAQIGAG
jgi:hypothetical protein